MRPDAYRIACGHYSNRIGIGYAAQHRPNGRAEDVSPAKRSDDFALANLTPLTEPETRPAAPRVADPDKWLLNMLADWPRPVPEIRNAPAGSDCCGGS